MSERPQQGPREVVAFHPQAGGATEREQLAPVTELPGGVQESTVWGGDEEWISTLPDPHDASVIDDLT